MIAKGLDFPKLNLVGLILADVGFHIPDFRASEKSYQLITQVAGRAGRHSETPGQVIVQTFNPEQTCLVYALKQDFEGFCEQELVHRKELHYPPFSKLAMFRFIGQTFMGTQALAEKFHARLMALRNHREPYKSLQILGPSPAPMSKLRNKYRFQILVKSPNAKILHTIAQEILPDFSKGITGAKVLVDIDPHSML
jgi:primosomal protein N' (replication factor Y)